MEKLDIFGRHIRTSITSVTTIDPLSAKMKCHSTEFPWNADYLDAILRISRVLAFLAILILLLSLNNENALLQTHSKFTHQHHVRMEQSKQVSEPNHHFHHCPVQTTPSQFMFNNVNSTTYVVTNTNDEEVRIPTGYYTIGETIAILNTLSIVTTFSISTKASSYGCIWIQSSHSIDFTNAPDIREILGLEG